MRILCFVALALLAGCQVSSEIVPAGKDSYMVSSKVGACGGCSAAIKSLKTANAYCAKDGKFVVVRNTSSSTDAFGHEVGNNLIFSCVNKDDPEYQRPTLRKDNGVTIIENR